MTKYCVNCVHLSNLHKNEWCAHPQLGISLTTGAPNVYMCSTARRDIQFCGPEGKKFDPKPHKPTLKEKLWRILNLK